VKESAAADNPPAEEPAILCAVAFSDYEIWTNPILRDPNQDGCEFFSTNETKRKKKLN
jgi:hypothetical protein